MIAYENVFFPHACTEESLNPVGTQSRTRAVGSVVQQRDRSRQDRPVHYDVCPIVAKQRLDFLAERAVSRAGLG